MYNKDICVIDFETTGTLERTKPTRIIQVGIVKLDKDTLETKDLFGSYVNPCEPLTSFITEYTGIKDSHIKDAPSFPFIGGCISDFINKDCIMAAWPLSFEQPILQWEYANAEVKYPIDRRGIDIGTLARYFMIVNKFPKLETYSLDSVSNCFSITNKQRHSALYDAVNEAEVLKYILKYEKI